MGNARTYLVAWLSARSQGGKVVLRIEDIDSPRVKAGAAEQALDDLRWLGLDWDDAPLVQTHRLASYESALARLQSQELVYPCTCTRSDVENAASAPHSDHEGPVYPGTCAAQSTSDASRLGNRPFAWRMRVGNGPFAFADGFRGPTLIDLRTVGGDFVVWKSAGTPAYQLAVVVDDAAQGVNEVVRGDDLLASTPRQLLLYRALGLTAPRFFHIPLVIGPDGRRLAKRHGDTRLASLRAAGVPPEEVIGLLAWSCGWCETMRPIAARALLARFKWDTLPREPFVLTPDILHESAMVKTSELWGEIAPCVMPLSLKPCVPPLGTRIRIKGCSATCAPMTFPPTS